MTFWIERKTMTKWRKVGNTFEPIAPWRIDRDPQDVLQNGLFWGPYKNKTEEEAK
jgi:hypothetical protein